MKGVRTAILLAAGAALWTGQPVMGGEEGEKLDPRELVELMLGHFATAPGNTNATIIDRRIAFNVRGAEGVWFYSQLNTGENLAIYRQRFHQLSLSDDGSKVIQRSFVPRDPERFVDAWENHDVIALLSEDDMEPALGEGCEQVWTREANGIWRGKVDPRSCEIFSERRQAVIRIGAEGFYDGDTMGTTERGFDADMNPIWGSQPGEFITLTRCRSYRCVDEARLLSAGPK